MIRHEHQWGEWFEPYNPKVGEVTRSRWCACGAYEMWRRVDFRGGYDTVTTSRDLTINVGGTSDNAR